MSSQDSQPDMKLFWGCFIALITTAFAFITRAFLVGDPSFWPTTFGLDQVQGQVLFGAGIWPFAISIIVFSLIIDQIGYRAAMVFSFICYALYAFLAFQAYGVVSAEGLSGDALKAAQSEAYDLLYMGSIILGLGNGTVEAFINPVVATMFNKDKTKWLNILHAGWPGGLVIGGILTIVLGEQAAEDWRILIYLIAIPAIVYLVMLLKARFPVNERVSSGTTYKEMLAEFGAIGALIAGYLIFRQLGMVFGWSDNMVYGLTAVGTVAYGLYCKSLGRPLLIFMCIIMIPLATTELGTDGAITGLDGGTTQSSRTAPTTCAYLHLCNHDDSSFLVCRSNCCKTWAFRLISNICSASHCWALFVKHGIRSFRSFCLCHSVRVWKDFLLADHAWRCFRTMPKRRCINP